MDPERSESVRVNKNVLKIQEDGNLILLVVKSRSKKLPPKNRTEKADMNL